MLKIICFFLLMVGVSSIAVGGIVISQIIAKYGWDTDRLGGASLLLVGAGIFIPQILTLLQKGGKS